MRHYILSILLSVISVTLSGAPVTIVIDAGHGGHDSGAPGKKIMEKEVNLKVALKLGEILKKQMKGDAKVIFTRDDDFFVTLLERANIANRNNATLFVSIHSNSIGDPKRRNVVSGASVYVRGLASSKQAQEVARRENSVLSAEDRRQIDTSSEESVLSELVWNKNLEQSIKLASNILDELVSTAGRRRGSVEQNDLAVLKRTKMPAVLVELEYICNEQMEKFMVSNDGQDKFALALANGIMDYCGFNKSKTTKTVRGSSAPEAKPDSTKRATSKPGKENLSRDIADKQSGVDFRIQFMTSSAVLNEGSTKFKGLKQVEHYNDGAVVKYTIGRYTTLDEANENLKEIRKHFPDAFVIKTIDGKRVNQ